ncbi:exported hypothetical protein [Xenorhabdus bovienii str. puntauvense]|uniref:Uncharacterized protein n=1 Tax=Xenorhabdus bovienii str. puntauvense TaxID=1398201 RepID=A0A077N7V3_XENBV|nr:exported hypothetical protein [Xenorhabdus bovienii str. puntauvense]
MRILKFLTLRCVLFLYTAQSYAQEPINHRQHKKPWGPYATKQLKIGSLPDVTEPKKTS